MISEVDLNMFDAAEQQDKYFCLILSAKQAQQQQAARKNTTKEKSGKRRRPATIYTIKQKDRYAFSNFSTGAAKHQKLKLISIDIQKNLE